MRLSGKKLGRLCRERHISLGALLRRARVSRTAYYSLARKDSVLPKSVGRIAQALGVSPSGFLSDDDALVVRMRELQERAETIIAANPGCDRDVVLRTLMNLELPSVERLRRALVRAPRTHIHG